MPYLLAASDTVYGLASGMTIKFFPVFWIQEVQLSPMAVQVRKEQETANTCSC